MVFRTAFNYLSQAGSSLLSGQSNEQHPLVGQSLEIGGNVYSVRTLLAEGGYALVFSVQDVKNGGFFALKRQLAPDKISADAIAQEIQITKKLSGHPAIVRFKHATQIFPEKRSGQHHYAEFLLLTELCSGGPLIDYIRRKDELNREQICKIFHAVCTAVLHMHDRNPPITHRDIKIENLLFDSRGFVKLCDFGSATTDIYRPNVDWNALMRSQLEEETAKFTTPMYRAPEILETYQNYPIGPAQDIWALGCVLFYLCFRVHPFEDSAKLRIINARYTIPAQTPFEIFHDLIRQTLQPDPYSRPSIQDLCEQIEEVATALNVNLNEPVVPSDELEALCSSEAQIPANSQLNQQTKMFLDHGMNLIKTIKEKAPVSSISEQLKTHLGFDSLQSSSNNSGQSERKVAPPRPPTLPSIQTQTFHLSTQRDDDSNEKFESKQTEPLNSSKVHVKETQSSSSTKEQQNKPTDFFSTLDWDSNFKKTAEEKCETNQPLIRNEFEFSKKSQTIDEPSHKQKSSDLLHEFDIYNSAQRSTQNENILDKTGSCDDMDVLKLLEQEIPQTSMCRNKSAPNFTPAVENKQKTADDIFAEFLNIEQNDSDKHSKSGVHSQRPDYSRKHFDNFDEISANKRETKGFCAFDDLLSQQGFTSSRHSNKTLADLAMEKDAEELDPVTLKIKYWTSGKQRNIRALLGSLSEILWDEAKASWSQPSVADMFEHEKIKKQYRRACLVVHPDKQSGTEHELLAKAIFTELNDAWNEFLKSS